MSNFASYKFSFVTSFYISFAVLLLSNADNFFEIDCLGFCLITEMVRIIFTAKSLILSFTLFIVCFLVIQIRFQRMFLYRIKLIYEDLDFKSNSLISTSSIVANSEVLMNDLSELAKLKRIEIESLKRQDEYRKEFIGNVAHELKTPLFSIDGYISNLLDGALEDKELLKKYLKRADKSVDRLTYIVKDLDLISQIESQNLKLDIKTFDIVELISETIDELEISASKKKIKILFDKNYNESVNVDADRNRIHQVLTNLISNSINYGKEKGTTEIGIEYNNGKVLLRINDNGEGISKDNMSRLFERFFRVDISRSRSHGGSGLGLAIVKHIIDAHNENINVQSTLQIGSEFSFTLKKSEITLN